MNPTNSGDALAQLQQTQAASQNPNDILTAQRQQLGVNSAQDTVTGLRGAIDNTTKLLQQVAPSVMGRTGSSLVTQAQASKQIQNEQAPISQNLTNEGTQYNEADQDLSKLQDEASTAASGIYQGQQDKLSYAQNLYNSLYQKEQDARAETDKQAALSEQAREANQTASKASGGNITINPSSSTPVSGTVGKVIQRNPSDFHFYDPSGAPITAAVYAKANNIPIGTILQQMGQAGDKVAQAAYNTIQKNPTLYTSNPGLLKTQFAQLFGGI